MEETCGWSEVAVPVDQFSQSPSTQEPEDVTPKYVMSFSINGLTIALYHIYLPLDFLYFLITELTGLGGTNWHESLSKGSSSIFNRF